LFDCFFRTFAAMLNRLQKKWKVNGPRLALIIATFAIGGSVTGYTARKLMPMLGVEQTVLWIVIYILLVTLLWPLAVILVSIPFGQFGFFSKYLQKIAKRFFGSNQSADGSRQLAVDSQQLAVESQQSADGSRQLAVDSQQSEPGDQGAVTGNAGSRFTIHDSRLTHLAIFASGTGTNAQKIIDYFRNSKKVRVSKIVCNKPGAGVIKLAEQNNIPVLLLDKDRFFNGDAYLEELKDIDWIILAGFLWKLPASLIKAFPHRIINIHPALLPSYGGKGMYGQAVHSAVIANQEKESGISIHYVDEHYDHGRLIFQARCPVFENDDPVSLAKRIQQLEHEHYPKIIERLIMANPQIIH
jgi:formyltetrahydrofolate-dependent phosphoribosylglycinamide formyltransferase